MPESSHAHATSGPSEPARGEGETGSRGWLTTLGWACYLACSWTWCIGMFLPVLLVRDYGLWGFVVFAVPNVLGAGAMGWIIRKRDTSIALIANNLSAARAFSLVTITFQLAFLGWIALSIVPKSLLAIAAASYGVYLLGAFGRYSALWVTAASFGISVACAALFLKGADAPPRWVESPSDDGIIAIAAVSAFGFALCPYLDLTFHGTRVALPDKQARVAFTLGFGVLFSGMIAFTLLYHNAMTPDEVGVFGALSSAAASPVVVHLLVRSGHVPAVHDVALAALARGVGKRQPMLLVTALILGGFLLGWFSLVLPPYGELPAPEVLYRLFMAFYGLVFPAYVWLCMIPARGGHSGIDGPIGRRKLLVWAIAVALAAPAFWMGFIEREEWWLGPGLAAVLLARLLIPGGAGFGRLPREPSGAPVPAPTRPPTLFAHAQPDRDPGGE